MAYSGVFVFGDSLVDAGNALKLANFYGSLPFTDLPEGAPYASLGYFQGRFSNGYTFADYLSNKYAGAVTKPIFPYDFEDPWLGVEIDPFAPDPSGNNLNFAYGGAQVVQGGEVVPDLDGQTDASRMPSTVTPIRTRFMCSPSATTTFAAWRRPEATRRRSTKLMPTSTSRRTSCSRRSRASPEKASRMS